MSHASRGEVVRIECHLEPMPVIALALRLLDDPPVVDKTGLDGKYTFTLEYANEMSTAPVTTPSGAPNLFHALQDGLGLQLVPKKLPFDVVVVDSIDKAPTAN